MKAIILDGHLKSSLAAIRSLGQKQIEFSVGAERNTAMGFYSRYTKDTFVYTSPLKDKEKFIDEVIAEAERMGDKPLLYGFSDATFLALIRHRIRIEKVATLIAPETPDVEIAFNKRKVLELAKEKDIRIPINNALDDLDDIAELARNMTYPAVVKPQHSVEWKDNKGYKGEVKIVHTPGELTAYAAKITTQTGEYPLVQAYVKGPEYGVELICEKGTARASLIHKRIRSLNPTGGASVMKKTLQEDETTREILRSAKELARVLNWHGVMMVEYKVNERSGNAFLMEINGRFWGSLPLAMHANVDFPYLYYRLAKSGSLDEENVTHTPDITSRHFFGDVHNLLAVFFSDDPMRYLIYPSRWQAFLDFFTPTGAYYDVLSARDLLPFIMEIIDTCYVLYRKIIS